MPKRKRDEPAVFSYAKFNLDALLKLASGLYGKPCHCDTSQKPRSGSLNWTIGLSFDNGVEWIFRSPRKSDSLDENISCTLLASEAATLKYVRKHSSIPVPEVFYYSAAKYNEIGVPFILMSKARGSPIKARTWNVPPSDMPSSKSVLPQHIKHNEKVKVMQQLGAISSQLSTLRFDKIGSLFEDEEGRCNVGECLSPGFIWGGRPSLEDISRGPFDTETEYYSALVNALSQHIQLLPLEHHAFFAPVPIGTEYNSFSAYRSATDLWNDFVTVGCKIDSSKNRLDYYIASRFLENMIPSLTANSDGKGNSNSYCLYHPDLSSSNIFVDDAFNITCVIDWGFASTVPLPVLFMPPGLPHPRDELPLALASEFKTGTLAYFNDEHSQKLDTDVWGKARKLWLFTRIVNLECLQDYTLFKELYTLVHGEPSESIAALFEQECTKEDVKAMRALLAEDDQPAADIKRQETEYFNAVGWDRHSMAKTLTVTSDLNKHFVADFRLWRWVMEAVPPSTWVGGYST